MINDIRQDLIEKIANTDDENLLLLLHTDYEYFKQTEQKDITDTLSEEDKEDLHQLSNEPFGYDTISQQELDEAIRQWRTR